MLNSRQSKAAFSCVALLAALLVLPATAADVPNQLPDPDGKPADVTKPVQVFILMGQSNMLGFGRIDPEDQNGTLSHLVRQRNKYPHLIDDAGNWTERKDVRDVHVMDTRGAGLTEFTKFQDVKNKWLTVNTCGTKRRARSSLSAATRWIRFPSPPSEVGFRWPRAFPPERWPRGRRFYRGSYCGRRSMLSAKPTSSRMVPIGTHGGLASLTGFCQLVDLPVVVHVN